jgi:hypothetical protein
VGVFNGSSGRLPHLLSHEPCFYVLKLFHSIFEDLKEEEIIIIFPQRRQDSQRLTLGD